MTANGPSESGSRGGRAGRIAANAIVAVVAAGGLTWAWMTFGEGTGPGTPGGAAGDARTQTEAEAQGQALAGSGVSGAGGVGRAPPSVPMVRGGWSVPVAGVAPEMLSDSFLDDRGEDRTHRAIDIAAPRGTPVVAAADGEIVRLFTSEAGGLTIYQRIAPAKARGLGGDRRLMAYYAHLDSYAPGLAEGQLVRRGTPLGAVGYSGNGSPDAPHLHFQLLMQAPGASWSEGEPVNPFPLLSGRGELVMPQPTPAAPSGLPPTPPTLPPGPSPSSAAGAPGGGGAAALAPTGSPG